MLTKTFYGPFHRAQLLILEFDDYSKFAAYVIGSHMHKSTAFRGKAGTQVYYGDDPLKALEAIRKFCPRAEWPLKWKRFVRKPLVEVL